MSLSSPFIHRPIATSLLMVAILLAGILAYKMLPVSALPDVDYPTIQVTAFYPGASPEVVASAVTAPLERQFGQMPGLNQMTSASSTGAMSITLQFSLGLGLDIAEQEVQAAINASGGYLPADLPNPPIYSKVNPADAPIITLALTAKTLPLPQVEDLADTRLAQKISQLPGVGLVSISGGQRPAVRVQVNSNALSAYGLSLEDVRSAIAAENVNMAKGNFDGTYQSYTINANDRLLSSKDYKPLVLAYKNGAPVRLSDVAQVQDAAENVKQAAWAVVPAKKQRELLPCLDAAQKTSFCLQSGGRTASLPPDNPPLLKSAEAAVGIDITPAIILNVQRQPGANVIEVVDRIKRLLPQLRAALPAAVDISVLSDRTLTIRASVKDAQFELLLSIALVVMVIFLFLRNLSATVIPSFSVPLSLVGTFGVMYLLGFSVNNLTLMALTIATGFVVDDAIVMIENITRFMEKGEKPLQAALKGSRQIGFTIISLTISLVAVLIPLLFMRDVVGLLFREFAITLAVAILISGVVSLTFTPMLCGRLLKSKIPLRKSPEANPPCPPFSKGGTFSKGGNLLEKGGIPPKPLAESPPFLKGGRGDFHDGRFYSFYANTLRWSLNHRGLILCLATLTLILTAALLYFIPKGFFPVEDTGIIQGISEASQTISFTAMIERQQALAKVVLQDPAVENLSSFIGIDGTNTTLNSGRILITLKPLSQRDVSASEVIRRLQPKLAQVPGITLYMQPIQDLSIDDRVTRTQFQYSLNSPDAAEVSKWSATLVNQLKQSNALRDVASDQQDLGLQTLLTIDRDTAARLGITMQMIDDTLYDAFGQRQVSTMFTQVNQYHVVLEALPELSQGPTALDNIYFNTADGQVVPLRTFAQMTQGVGPLVINRQGQFPVVTISFNLAPQGTLGEAVRAIHTAKEEIAIPDSIETSFEGAARAFQNALANEIWLVLATIIVVYIVLGVLYESYIHPLTILSTLPSACMGALLALLLTGSEFSVIALIGIILLIGIVMKNAILMIDFALDLERLEGKSPEDAIYEACLLRFRPILMTTMVAMLGAVPLALGTGMGAELRQPLGIAIIGGLIVSQLLTLYTTPVIYLLFGGVGRSKER